jgi:hypothetical protein
MKRLGLVALLLALALPAAAGDWLTTTATNPTANTVLLEAIASTDETSILFCAIGASTGAAVFRVQHRNAANDTTLREQFIPVVANGMQEFCMGRQSNFALLEGERVRIVVFANVTGSVSVSLDHNVY